VGCGVWGVECGVWGMGYGVWGLGFEVWGLGCGVWVWGLGRTVSVEGLGFQGIGWKDPGRAELAITRHIAPIRRRRSSAPTPSRLYPPKP
jgi:hypothetical protein